MKRKIFVGLGNPDEQYEATYHNVGAEAVRAMARNIFEDQKLKFERHSDDFTYITSGSLVFVIPLTYMNESGIAVREALKKWDAAPSDLTVLHDDSDLTIGTYKVSVGQSAAGHHGVESIIDAIGANTFTRVRIGVRDDKEVKRKKAGEFVLKKITKKDAERLGEVFTKIADELL